MGGEMGEGGSGEEGDSYVENASAQAYALELGG